MWLFFWSSHMLVLVMNEWILARAELSLTSLEWAVVAQFHRAAGAEAPHCIFLQIALREDIIPTSLPMARRHDLEYACFIDCHVDHRTFTLIVISWRRTLASVLSEQDVHQGPQLLASLVDRSVNERHNPIGEPCNGNRVSINLACGFSRLCVFAKFASCSRTY